MPRGRPPKNKKILDKEKSKYIKTCTKHSKGSGKSILRQELDDDLNDEIIEAPRQKRKYTKRRKMEQNIADDETIIRHEAKKRGRKRGRKKKDQDQEFKPEDVLDYMIRNYPQMGIDRIRDKVIDGLKVMKELGDNPYLLYKFSHDGNTYYYDDKNAILNTDGSIVGYFVKQEDGSNKMFSILQKNKDMRTFAQVIDSIEKSDKSKTP
jgi:hypothetical protein